MKEIYINFLLGPDKRDLTKLYIENVLAKIDDEKEKEKTLKELKYVLLPCGFEDEYLQNVKEVIFNSNCKKVKLFTIQDKKILDILNKEQIFYPEIAKSSYIDKESDEEMKAALTVLYGMALQGFNNKNNTDYNGLVFAFAKSDNTKVDFFENFSDFVDYVTKHNDTIHHLFRTLDDGNHVILELEYDLDFGITGLDINDFEILIPPYMNFGCYPRYVIEKLVFNLEKGVFTSSTFPSGIAQIHIPFIKKENIINIYDTFRL